MTIGVMIRPDTMASGDAIDGRDAQHDVDDVHEGDALCFGIRTPTMAVKEPRKRIV